MTEPLARPVVAPVIPSRVLPVLPLLFIGSGCAALIYEIVWFQLVELVIGSSAISLGVLLGTFMGGMCLGSLLLPRIIAPSEHPLRVYAALEAGIGVLGLLILFGLPALGTFYASISAGGFLGILLRGLFCAICLLVPTVLMGATLPAVARWVESTPEGVSWLGFFYGSNIAGAVIGCLLAGFYLLRVFDMAVATYVAVAINAAVAGAAYLIALTARHQPHAVDRAAVPVAPRHASRVCRDRDVGPDRARGRGGLDAAAFADAGRHGVHLFAHPCRHADRTRRRQQRRRVHRARHAGRPAGAGLVPDAAPGGDGLDGLHDRAVVAVLAGEPVVVE